jgi:hypothetical protein
MAAPVSGPPNKISSVIVAEDLVTGGFDGADPDKGQRKRSNEFSEANTEFIHSSMQSNCLRRDKRERRSTSLRHRWLSKSTRQRNLDISRATAARRGPLRRSFRRVDRP